jgi:hypothetical protein
MAADGAGFRAFAESHCCLVCLQIPDYRQLSALWVQAFDQIARVYSVVAVIIYAFYQRDVTPQGHFTDAETSTGRESVPEFGTTCWGLVRRRG